MASTSNLVDVVRHYQRSIDKHDEDEQRVSYPSSSSPGLSWFLPAARPLSSLLSPFS